MKKQDDVRSTFTLIYHRARIELELNLLEYVLLDTVFYLSQNSKGYCYKSVRALAKDLGMSFDGIRKAIIRLTKSGKLICYKDGYKTYDTFIQTVHLEADRSAVKNRSTDRSAVHSDRLAVTTDRFVASQQMLDIQENNNRNTYGSSREDPREPKETKPLSATALRLQQQLEQIRTKGTGNNQTSAKQ